MATIICTTVTFGVFGLIRENANTLAQQPLQKSYQEAQEDLAHLYKVDCHASFADTDALQCEFGNLNATESIVLFGDSHAAHWFAAVEHYAIDNNYRLVTHTKSSCPSIVIEPFDSYLRRSYFECTLWRNNVFDQIEKSQPKMVILSNLMGYLESSLSESEQAKSYRDSYRHTLNSISVPTVVIKDIGFAPYSIPKCLARNSKRTEANFNACDFKYKENISLTGAEEETIAKFDDAFYVNLNESICPNGVCPAMTGDRINYIDNNHMSNELSKALAKPLAAELDKLGF